MCQNNLKFLKADLNYLKTIVRGPFGTSSYKYGFIGPHLTKPKIIEHFKGKKCQCDIVKMSQNLLILDCFAFLLSLGGFCYARVPETASPYSKLSREEH